MQSKNENRGNILVVSSDENAKNLIHSKLLNDGYRYSECEDTSIALKHLLIEEIDVILLDNDLPQDNINQLLQEINSKQLNVVVIIITDILNSGDAVKLFSIGAYDYIIKPFGIDEMTFSIQRAVEKIRLQREYKTLHQFINEGIKDQVIQNNENFYRIMSTLSFAMEGKDSYTAGHSRRVSALSLAIGRAMDLTERDLDDLHWGGMLHDLGKIAVDQNIVNKAGKLTPEEYACVMTHPVVGATMFASVAKNIRISEIIEYHHLSYNGEDPLQPLKEKDIPLLARIVTLADAYDAMTSDRSYRSALSHEEAIAVIKKESGIKFDPDIVDVFLRISPQEAISEKSSILIADDEQSIRLLIRSILGNEYSIIEACNGQDAIELAQKHHPSLVLMDIFLPVKDGFSACSEIKNNHLTKNIPVIMFTAHNSELNKRISAEVGASDYLTKPFNITRLLEAVKGYLNQDNKANVEVN